jgi:spore coat polysaccharide biosynthesis protein SpsF
VRIVGIVQARMGSSRLPGKVLRPIRGIPLLQYQLTRLRHARELDDLCVATTQRQQDDPIETLCRGLGVGVFRGSEEDVLQRYVQAAESTSADAVVRLTGDCPLLDPLLLDAVVRAFRAASPPYDYYSNTLDRGFPPGMDVEVIDRKALERADREATDPAEREHVTLHLYRRPSDYRLGSYDYRLTVDTLEDFERVKKIIEMLEPTEAAPSFTELTAWIHDPLTT